MLRKADAAAPDGRGSLRALHLGFTRAGPAGIDALTQLRGLTALSFEGEDITSDCVQVRLVLSLTLGHNPVTLSCQSGLMAAAHTFGQGCTSATAGFVSSSHAKEHSQRSFAMD